MINLKGEQIYLRALEPSDLEFLYQIENDELVWEVSNTSTPYSKFVLKKYLKNSHRDIYDIKQLRLVICNNENSAVGLIDLFDFDPKHHRVGVGVIVVEAEQKKGYAKEALELVCDYAFKHLNVNQVYANISTDNTRSISLFEAQGFTSSGEKRDWIFTGEGYVNELIYQLGAHEY